MSRFDFKLPPMITGTNAGETLNGTDGNDFIYGYNGNDTIYGGNGHDTIYGGDQSDTLWGGWGNDTLIGGTGDDTLRGEQGDDVLDGGWGNDTMHGGTGNNVFIPGQGNDKAYGGDDHDTVDYSTLAQGVNVTLHATYGQGTVTGRDGLVKSDTLISVEKVIGGQGDDHMVLSATTEAAGGEGNDTFVSGSGANVINGGGGFDTVSYMGRAQGIQVDLAKKTASDGDTLFQMENVIGTAHADRLYGNDASNTLSGGDGFDILEGGGGTDRLIGGRDADDLTGGTGADRFVFQEKADSVAWYWFHKGLVKYDTIHDFNRAEGDKIELKGLGAFVFGGDLQDRPRDGNGFDMLPREIGFKKYAGETVVLINLDADARADMEIHLKGVDGVQMSDFIFA